MKQWVPKRSAAFYARLLALAVLASGITATVIAARNGRVRHQREVMRVFAAESEAMRQSVARQVNLFLDVLASIGALHELSDRISAEDFNEFAAKGMQFQRRLLQAYGFVQRVPHALRVEMQARPGQFVPFLDPESTGSFREAAVRPEYFVLVSQQPEGALGFPPGLDLAALPGALESIISMDTRRGPAIARFLRLQDREGGAGYYVFSPLVDRRIHEEGVLSGFVVSILWPQQVLDRALADVATRDVLIRFHDEAIPEETGVADVAAGALMVRATVPVADRTWRFETTASPEYLAARTTILPGVILVTGGAITLLLSITIWLLAGQTERIELVVGERTRELQASMQERMRLEGELLEIGEREKQKIGHDLHDSLGQKLTGAVFLSRALAKALGGHDAEACTQAERINEILKESVAQVRRMARGLSPVDLGHEGLGGALRRLTEEIMSVYGIHCVYHDEGDASALSAAMAHHLYAIALEAVNNAVRHGKAGEVMLELGVADGHGCLAVEDNGGGFDPAAVRAGGMGLRVMEHRATMIGGRMSVVRRPEGGMRLTCVF